MTDKEVRTAHDVWAASLPDGDLLAGHLVNKLDNIDW